ncbi:hypothetical protein DL766_002297 [Monosporascus sp. MC13-8B]|uniref:F-box domain-containing protein n=1 Tax=Monosporascus cannonballus TaxID=155416 RepID=A0ABY0HF00_9PEZI|nr:hypothetical protein DL763_010757 [Monosporascus cannonballus]RYO91944.1 hypothetical protein DL762_001882 [Monosporascus cannonballus]RYP35830.1 hypothetical protein DL766_002297 [Monosporascus sp. MC13-8B]
MQQHLVLGQELLQGCHLEAHRANIVAIQLQGLRAALPEHYYAHLDALIGEIQIGSKLLRDVGDQLLVHIPHVPQVVDYLNVLLPCLCKSLRDITIYYNDRTMTKEKRWRYLYYKMGAEHPGILLPARFSMYNQYLQFLLLLLARSPNFNINALDDLKDRILQLRETRNIPPPTTVTQGELIRRGDLILDWNHQSVSSAGHGHTSPSDAMQNTHWAESIFLRSPRSKGEFRKHGVRHRTSEAFGPLLRLGQFPMTQGPMSRDVKILFKRSFDNDRISVIFFLQGIDQAPFLYVRSFDNLGEPWVSRRGAHELCIRRDSSSTLTLTRWSDSERRRKRWAALRFATWEELVLFHCAFVCLKAHSLLTVMVDPEEFILNKERRLFQAQIIDDGFHHSLMVYEDRVTKGIRLHTAVWDGKLRYCPVWTAFVTPHCFSPSWLVRKSPHRVWLKDLDPFVFCQRYRPRNQRNNKAGAFELDFVNDVAATHFKEIFSPDPGPAPTITTATEEESSENATTAGGGDDAFLADQSSQLGKLAAGNIVSTQNALRSDITVVLRPESAPPRLSYLPRNTTRVCNITLLPLLPDVQNGWPRGGFWAQGFHDSGGPVRQDEPCEAAYESTA